MENAEPGFTISARKGNAVRAENHRDLVNRPLGFRVPAFIEGGKHDSDLVVEKFSGITWKEAIESRALSLSANIKVAQIVAKQMKTCHKETGIWLLDREPSNILISEKQVGRIDNVEEVEIKHVDLGYVFDDKAGGLRTKFTGKVWQIEPFEDPEDEIAHNIAAGVCLSIRQQAEVPQNLNTFMEKWNNGDTTDPEHFRLNIPDLEHDLSVLQEQLSDP